MKNIKKILKLYEKLKYAKYIYKKYYSGVIKEEQITYASIEVCLERNQFGIRFDWYDYDVHTEYFWVSEYGKTWSLTKEELENE